MTLTQPITYHPLSVPMDASDVSWKQENKFYWSPTNLLFCSNNQHCLHLFKNVSES